MGSWEGWGGRRGGGAWVGLRGGAWAGGAGPAGARTQPARPLPGAMLVGVWVSNGARRGGCGGGGGGGSAGSGRSRLPGATDGRSHAPGPARRSGGEPGPAGLGEQSAASGCGPSPFPGGGRPGAEGSPESAPHCLHPDAHLWRDPTLSNQALPRGLEHGSLRIWIPLSAARTPPAPISLSGS